MMEFADDILGLELTDVRIATAEEINFVEDWS